MCRSEGGFWSLGQQWAKVSFKCFEYLLCPRYSSGVSVFSACGKDPTKSLARESLERQDLQDLRTGHMETQGNKVRVDIELLQSPKFSELFTLMCFLPSIFDFWEAHGSDFSICPFLLEGGRGRWEVESLKVSFPSRSATICNFYSHFCLPLLCSWSVYSHTCKAGDVFPRLVEFFLFCLMGGSWSLRAWKQPGKGPYSNGERISRFRTLRVLTGFCQQREPQGWARKLRLRAYTRADSMDHSPGSSVHGIPQARILQWVAISYYKVSSPFRYRTRVSCTGGWISYHCATWEAQTPGV